jgi:hypothetical protein
MNNIQIDGLTQEQCDMLDVMWALDSEEEFLEWYENMLSPKEQLQCDTLQRLVLLETFDELMSHEKKFPEANDVLRKFLLRLVSTSDKRSFVFASNSFNVPMSYYVTSPQVLGTTTITNTNPLQVSIASIYGSCNYSINLNTSKIGTITGTYVSSFINTKLVTPPAELSLSATDGIKIYINGVNISSEKWAGAQVGNNYVVTFNGTLLGYGLNPLTDQVTIVGKIIV